MYTSAIPFPGDKPNFIVIKPFGNPGNNRLSEKHIFSPNTYAWIVQTKALSRIGMRKTSTLWFN